MIERLEYDGVEKEKVVKLKRGKWAKSAKNPQSFLFSSVYENVNLVSDYKLQMCMKQYCNSQD